MPLEQNSTVSIVDDDASVCDSLGVMLSVFGFDTRTYRSGGEYLADARHREPGYHVIDQHMPNVSGLDVVCALRREGASTPVVLITGRIDEAITERARRLGVIHVLEKPFPATRLLELLRAELGTGGGPPPLPA